MRCEEAAEFVSALWDGENIPPAAAEHIGACEDCRARLREYAEAGVELRRLSCLEPVAETGAAGWMTKPMRMRNWRLGGWGTMRIPRLVFALLVVAIVVLGSSLAIVKTRAGAQGKVLMLTATPPGGRPLTCALPLGNLKSAACAGMQQGSIYKFRVIATEGNRIELGVSVGRWTPASVHEATGSATSLDILQRGVTSMDSLLKDLPEKTYWLEPGKELRIPFPGSGSFTITGALTDHMPPLVPSEPGDQLEPGPNELRFVSPVLVRGKDVVFDLEGATAIAPDKSYCVELYAPGQGLGLFRISLAPQEGAVEGSVLISRVHFELDGQPYTFLLGAPATRSKNVWVLRDKSYKPPRELEGREFMGNPKLSRENPQPPIKN